MSEVPAIIDSGGGPKLSTCRITVQDVFPYLHWSNDRIREVMPILREDEIEVIRLYVAEHLDEVAAEDRMIRARSEARLTSAEALAEAEARKRLAEWRAARAQSRERTEVDA
jgi:hypothetical protein